MLGGRLTMREKGISVWITAASNYFFFRLQKKYKVTYTIVEVSICWIMSELISSSSEPVNETVLYDSTGRTIGMIISFIIFVTVFAYVGYKLFGDKESRDNKRL